jgi:hypothetical protein
VQYRTSSRPRRVQAALASAFSAWLALGLAACIGGEGKPPGNLSWSVTFACDADRTASDQLRLRMCEGDCNGPILYDELLQHGDEASGAPPVKPGIYGFQAIALREGMQLAQRCVLAELPARSGIALQLASDACTEGSMGSADASSAEDEDAAGPSAPPDPDDAGEPSQIPDPSVDGSMTVATPEAGPVIDCGDEGVALASCGVCGRVCAAGQSCENGACRPAITRGATCTAQRFRDHDYLFCEDKRSWSSARKLCRDMGFGLVTIEDQAENDFIARFVGKVDRWLGANDIGTNDIGVSDIDIGVDDFGLGNVASSCGKVAGPVGEGNWYWASRSADLSNATALCALSAANASGCAPIESRYQNWNAGEPENAGCTCLGVCLPGEDCGMFLAATGKWSDRPCLSFVSYVCESP